jgi:hypothetical protein
MTNQWLAQALFCPGIELRLAAHDRSGNGVDFVQWRGASIELTVGEQRSRRRVEENGMRQTMKPLFVRMKNGHCTVHWPKLVAFAVVVLILTTAIVEGLCLLLTQRLSVSALVVALVFATLIVVRATVRAVSYQKEELEMTVGPS